LLRSLCFQEVKRIKAAGGKVEDGRVNGHLGVARAFGDALFLDLIPADPFLASYKLTKQDHFIILGCDGVFDVYEDQELVDMVERMIAKDGVTDPQRWAKAIVDKCLERGSDDNVSVIVIALNDKKIHSIPVSLKVSQRRAKALGGKSSPLISPLHSPSHGPSSSGHRSSSSNSDNGHSRSNSELDEQLSNSEEDIGGSHVSSPVSNARPLSASTPSVRSPRPAPSASSTVASARLSSSSSSTSSNVAKSDGFKIVVHSSHRGPTITDTPSLHQH